MPNTASHPIQARRAPRARTTSLPGEIGLGDVRLGVADLGRALAFYGDRLGLDIIVYHPSFGAPTVRRTGPSRSHGVSATVGEGAEGRCSRRSCSRRYRWTSSDRQSKSPRAQDAIARAVYLS